MFERILVAIDGSAESSKTLPVALEMAERFGSSVTVVHVREHAKYEGSDVDLGPDIDLVGPGAESRLYGLVFGEAEFGLLRSLGVTFQGGEAVLA